MERDIIENCCNIHSEFFKTRRKTFSGCFFLKFVQNPIKFRSWLFREINPAHYQYLISREGITAFQKLRKILLLSFLNPLMVLYCRNLQTFPNAHVREYFREKEWKERKSHELLQNVKIMNGLNVSHNWTSIIIQVKPEKHFIVEWQLRGKLSMPQKRFRAFYDFTRIANNCQGDKVLAFLLLERMNAHLW